MNSYQLQRVKKESDRLQAVLGSTFRGNKVRAVTAVTRHLLLHGPFMYNGRLCHPKAKSLGAGVYEIWLEESHG